MNIHLPDYDHFGSLTFAFGANVNEGWNIVEDDCDSLKHLDKYHTKKINNQTFTGNFMLKFYLASFHRVSTGFDLFHDRFRDHLGQQLIRPE